MLQRGRKPAKTRRWGRIIWLSSSLEGLLKPKIATYTASKAAVETMTKILAKELEGTGITANCVAPGPTATHMFLTGTSEELIERVIEECPHGRLGETKDVAPLVGFLVSDASEWINGRLLVLMVALSRVWLVQYFEICILYINATIIPVI